MPFLIESNRRFLAAVSKLQDANPYLPEEMIASERQAPSEEASEEESIWSMTVSDPDRVRENTWKIMDRLTPLLSGLRSRLADASEADSLLYEDAWLFYFYYRYYRQMLAATFSGQASKARWAFYREFASEWREFFTVSGARLPSNHQAGHMFACYYQVVRGFYHIFEQIIGSSNPAARLHATIWQSVFTHDIRRYRRTPYSRMNEFAT